MILLRLFINIAALVILTGCVTASPSNIHLQREEPRWRSATVHPVRGVALVVHGLNMRPSAMDPFCEFLGELGLHSYRITLTGHNQPTTGVFDETVWVDDVIKAYKEVRAEFPHLPTYVVGYSLGGLLVTHALDDLSMDTHPHALVLLAPAISLRTPLALLADVGLPPALSLSVPNIAPDLYRRYPITPLFWYSNTLTLSEETRTLQHAQSLKEIPTLIALNPADELISESGTTEWITLNNLAPEWRTFVIHKDTEGRHLPEHVIVDERSLGTAEWGRMKGTIGEFITSRSVIRQ